MTSDFPLFRLVTQLARQISSPVAVRIKKHARSHPWFRRHLCAAVGRAYLSGELRARLWTLALRQPRHLPPVSEQRALDTGADILGEIIVFGLGAAIVVFEVNRQAMKQERKDLEGESQWVALLVALEELKTELQLQQDDLERLDAALRTLAEAPGPLDTLP